MSFIPTFDNGPPILPANSSFQAILLTANVTLVWALEQQNGLNYPVAGITDVTPDAGGRVITMPDARETSEGTAVLFRNTGAFTFTVKSATGVTLMTVASGEMWELFITDNSTQSGTWGVVQFGAGASSANAGALAGAGIKAITSTLNQSMPIEPKNSNYILTNNDRAQVVLWNGGVGAFTLPQASVVGSDWFAVIKNMGSGTLTVNTAHSETIDGGATISVAVADSCFITTDGVNYYTIGFGQSVNSQFDYISIDVSGTGNYIIAGVQLNRISYNLTGVLTGNRNFVVPASIQQYWVQNNTTGAFTLTVKTPAGTGVAIPQGDSGIVFCDGTNIVNAANSGSVTFPISIGQGGTGQTTAAAGLTALGGVPTARTITAGVGLSGGGDLSANRSLAVSLLGIESLSDPNADRIMFWDDSAGDVTWLSLDTGLSISGTLLIPVFKATSTGLINTSGTITVDRTGTDTNQVGYLDIPLNTQNANYSLAITDRGKTVYHSSGTAHAWTIPANSTTAFPIGTAITMVNDNGGGVITVTAAGGVTLRQAGTTNTGNRSLAANGLCTILKVGTDTWFVSGTGIT